MYAFNHNGFDDEELDWPFGVHGWSCGTYQGHLHSRARHHSSEHPFRPSKSEHSVRRMENQSANTNPVMAQARFETYKCACVNHPL